MILTQRLIHTFNEKIDMYNKRWLVFIVMYFVFTISSSYGQELSYYLPDIKYDKSIPSPELFFGHQVGEWHLTHDKQYYYLKALAESSPRITLTEYARSYENRPLVYLIITSERNQKEIENIRKEHLKWIDPNDNSISNAKKLPIVIYQGFSIHGNEPSGGNAAPLMAYYLAAAKSKEVEQMLGNAVIILDPCFNPDGFNRFATWANMHKNKNLTADNADREYSEAWPGGRTNHYWFDLNRDWLPLRHPESRGRMEVFHAWKPNVLTDHHEMGTNSTFFFMPGEPTRVHPLTPSENQKMTAALAQYNADALDEIGSLYFSKEGYDDFYMGKGSTYPDVNGCIGVLFEQASSRGHLQDSDNGVLSFPFTIRNQVVTALSTYKGIVELREELLNYQRTFFQNARAEAQNDPVKGYIFSADNDYNKLATFIDVLNRHQVKVYQNKAPKTVAGKTFEARKSYIIPMDQLQYKFIKAAFDVRTSFLDSLFYDVSTWTFPLMYNLQYAPLNKKEVSGLSNSDLVTYEDVRPKILDPEYAHYAYVFSWEDYNAPALLNAILQKEIRVKVATSAFTLNGQQFARGSIMIPVHGQAADEEELYKILQETSIKYGVQIYDMDSGYASNGPDLGSRQFQTIEKVNCAILTGDGISYLSAGYNWYLLDQQYDMVLTKLDIKNISNADLSHFTTIIMPSGSYNRMYGSGIDALRTWVKQGGNLIVIGSAAKWVDGEGMMNIEFRKPAKIKYPNDTRFYENLQRDKGAQYIGGALLRTVGDLSHPLMYGFTRSEIPVFKRGTLTIEPSKNPYATPLRYTSTPLWSGYVSSENQKKIASSAAIVVGSYGAGRVVVMSDEPAFRSFGIGTSKIMANAIFFTSIIDSRALER